jgi:outer membrane protein OmpA-like peptidoglycan-associated protein
MDRCPDHAGDAAYYGCPDTDGDGLNDLVDRCPLVAGPLKEKGCPEISKEDKKALDLAVRNIEFETGSDVLKSESLPVLDQVVEILDRYANYKVHIGGHTDNVGKAKANQKLSEKRAQACMQYLTKKGIAADRLSAKGYGHTKPVATNNTPAGRQKNRRVEFGLKKW